MLQSSGVTASRQPGCAAYFVRSVYSVCANLSVRYFPNECWMLHIFMPCSQETLVCGLYNSWSKMIRFYKS